MAVNRQSVTLADFSGGDEGLSRPGGLSDPTTFRALNVWRYANGIGPRQPVIAFPVSGSYMKAVQLFDLVPGEQVMVIYKDGQAREISSGTSNTPTGSFTNLPVDSVTVGGQQIYVSPDGYGFKYHVPSTTITDVPTMPAARRIDTHGIRFIIMPVTGVAPDAQSVWWSAAGPDEATWPGTNFLQVAPSAGLVDFWRQGNNFVTLDGQGNIYVMSGAFTETSDTDLTLRTIEQAGPLRNDPLDYPFYPQGGVSQLGYLWWRSGTKVLRFDGNRVITRPGFERPSTSPILSNNIPSQFLSLSEQGEFIWVMPGADSGASTTIALTLHHEDNAFTQHSVPVTSYTAEREPRVLGSYSRALRRLWLTTGGSDSEAPNFYTWDYERVFPITTSDGDSGAPVTASFRSGDWFAPEGTLVRVHSVTVDYSYAPAAVGSSRVQFDISVEAVSQGDNNVTVESTPQSFTPSGVTTDSPDFSLIQRGRQTFGMGDQGDGAGFRVHLANWRGIIIHQIVVSMTTEEIAR